MLSYNNSASPDKDTMLKIINKYAKNVNVIDINHNYQLTGKLNKNKNKEYLFLIDNSNNIK